MTLYHITESKKITAKFFYAEQGNERWLRSCKLRRARFNAVRSLQLRTCCAAKKPFYDFIPYYRK